MSRQYIRSCNLVVSGAGGSGLDLSNMRIVFTVRKTDSQTPNTAEIRIYNLAPNTAQQIRDEFQAVSLQAGYEHNKGVIFTGNIKQVRMGRDNGTDSYVDIAAGDGDEAYNNSVVNTTLSAGATQSDQINTAAKTLKGVDRGYVADTGGQGLPRGKSLYGMTRDYMRQSAAASGTTWSIQDGRLQVVERSSVLPNQAVLLTGQTGLIGSPEQTNDGIRALCLLNPMLQVGGRVKIDAAVTEARASADTEQKPAAISADGVYRVLAIEHAGDTFGDTWFSDLICLDVDESAPADKKVKKT